MNMYITRPTWWPTIYSLYSYSRNDCIFFWSTTPKEIDKIWISNTNNLCRNTQLFAMTSLLQQKIEHFSKYTPWTYWNNIVIITEIFPISNDIHNLMRAQKYQISIHFWITQQCFQGHDFYIRMSHNIAMGNSCVSLTVNNYWITITFIDGSSWTHLPM